jgi:hypothetical protein
MLNATHTTEGSGCRPMIFEKLGRLWGVRANGRSSIGTVFVHIATAAVILFTTALARGQQQAEPDGEKIKLYIGVSRGDLIDDNENDLRAFAVVQQHVNRIGEQLSKDVRTEDLRFWKYGQWQKLWQKLRPLPISHYVNAHAKKKDSAAIEVEWNFGKFPANDFSPDRQLEYAGVLKQKTIITITDDTKGPAIEQKADEKSEPVKWNDPMESADTIVAILKKILPEMRKAHGYFVDCFKNEVSDWQDLDNKMMAYLSEKLEQKLGQNEGVVLFPVVKLSTYKLAASMCSEPGYKVSGIYHYDEANLYVSGSIWLHGKDNWVQPRITVGNRLRDDRQKFAIPLFGGARVDETPELDQFCMKSRELSFQAIEALTRYIQARGFNARKPTDLGDWNCG